MGFPDSSVGKESTCQWRRPQFNSWVGKICWRRDRLPTPVFLGFLVAQQVKNPPAMRVDLGSIPGLGRYPGEGKSYPLQWVEIIFSRYFGLENSMDSPWGHKELDMTERLSIQSIQCVKCSPYLKFFKKWEDRIAHLCQNKEVWLLA